MAWIKKGCHSSKPSKLTVATLSVPTLTAMDDALRMEPCLIFPLGSVLRGVPWRRHERPRDSNPMFATTPIAPQNRMAFGTADGFHTMDLLQLHGLFLVCISTLPPVHPQTFLRHTMRVLRSLLFFCTSTWNEPRAAAVKWSTDSSISILAKASLDIHKWGSKTTVSNARQWRPG